MQLYTYQLNTYSEPDSRSYCRNFIAPKCTERHFYFAYCNYMAHAITYVIAFFSRISVRISHLSVELRRTLKNIDNNNKAIIVTRILRSMKHLDAFNEGANFSLFLFNRLQKGGNYRFDLYVFFFMFIPA